MELRIHVRGRFADAVPREQPEPSPRAENSSEVVLIADSHHQTALFLGHEAGLFGMSLNEHLSVWKLHGAAQSLDLSCHTVTAHIARPPIKKNQPPPFFCSCPEIKKTNPMTVKTNPNRNRRANLVRRFGTAFRISSVNPMISPPR